MGKPKKQVKKYNYSTNRKRLYKKSRKLPYIQCDEIRHNWNRHKSVKQNLAIMHITYDVNKSIGIPKNGDNGKNDIKEMNNEELKKLMAENGHLIHELETKSKLPVKKTLKLSQNEIDFCTYMMEKHGENYKAMALDKRNYYQETPKRIRQKILTFMSIYEQLNSNGKSK